MAKRTTEIRSTLVKFYNKPVAQVSLELFLSIGAVIFFAMFAIRPTLLTMSDLIKEIEDKRELDNQFTQKIAALSSVQSLFLTNQEKFSLLDEAIPPQPEFETAIKIIEKIASDQKLVIQSMTVREIPKDAPEELAFSNKTRISLPVSISIIGDYNQIRTFVEQLQASRRLFVVDNIRFTVSQDRGLRNLKAIITVNIQYYGLDKDLKDSK